MYHPLAVHIQQPLGNAFELPRAISSVKGGVNAGVRPYKFESIRIPMGLDELGDVPIDHPFRNHRKEVFTHRHSQQWEYIRMAEDLPCHNFLAEHLCDHRDH